MPDAHPSLSPAARDYLVEHGFTPAEEIGVGDWIGCDPPVDMPPDEYQRHYAEAARIADAEQQGDSP